MNNNVEELVENVLQLTEQKLKNIFSLCERTSDSKSIISSRIIFPKYSNDNQKTRISEQELRCAFIESFNEYCNNPQNKSNYFYSVETPTKDKYSGFKTENPKISYAGRSGAFDMVIHDEQTNRVCLIEFKSDLKDIKEYNKDFLKLSNNPKEGDNTVLRYFIELVSKSNHKNLKEIKRRTIDNRFNNEHIVKVRCISLSGIKEGLIDLSDINN